MAIENDRQCDITFKQIIEMKKGVANLRLYKCPDNVQPKLYLLSILAAETVIFDLEQAIMKYDKTLS